MEQNGTLERQVWQRVTAPIAQDASVGIEPLLREVLSQVGLYRQLSGRLSGPAGELLKAFGLSADHIVEVAKEMCE